MREILFRAKREDNREWVYGYYARLPDAAGSVHIMHVPAQNPDEHNNAYYIIPDTVGEFTGLTDKNGTMIFEGDIVELEGDAKCTGTDIYIVEYDSGAFCLCHNNRLARFVRHYNDYVEVIGNIHDTPELMKGDEPT